MIRRIGVICQDANSVGFLCGLQARLGCEAELVQAPAAVGRSTFMASHQAQLAWKFFEAKAVDLMVRFTDADGNRWQDVQRHELDVFPAASKSLLICGVAVRNVEWWLAIDRGYLASVLGLAPGDLDDDQNLTDRVKAALARMQKDDQTASDIVAAIVAGLPPEVFRRWLDDPALRALYDECRAAAARAGCAVANEM